MEAAYDDAAGVTAAFNRNLLARINRELGGDFRLDEFLHHAPYNPTCAAELRCTWSAGAGRRSPGRRGRSRSTAGEPIFTERSYKYPRRAFPAHRRPAGLARAVVWTDDPRWFSVQYLTSS